MKKLLLLLLTTASMAQSKLETTLNFGLRSADMAQTCYLLHNIHGQREDTLLTQSCGGVVAISSSWMIGSWWLDHRLQRRHPRLAHFQLFSAGGAAFGIGYTIHNTRY